MSPSLRTSGAHTGPSPPPTEAPDLVQAAGPIVTVPGLRQFLFVTISATWIE